MSKANDLANALLKAIGGNDEQSTPSIFLDTGYPPLNFALSGRYDGGLPVGRIVEMFGPPSSGKTAISTRAMIAAQQAGGFAGFNDHERSFHHHLAANLGLDVEAPTFAFKTPRTFEESVTIAVKAAQTIREGGFIDEKAPIIWVFDSLAAMVPKSKMDKGVDEYGMNDTTALARATSSVFPALSQHCEELNMLALFLNQIRTKPGVIYGDPTTTPGGDAPKYYASIRIQLGAKRIVEGADKRMVGQEIGCKIIKNKVYRPFEQASWRFMFREDGSGYFDVTTSLIDYMIEQKILESSGPRVTWTDGKQYFKKALVEKIESEGLQGELRGLLPKAE